jgi:hypothetical protein
MSDIWQQYSLILWALLALLVLLAFAWLFWLQWVTLPALKSEQKPLPEIEQLEKNADQLAHLLWSTMEMRASLGRTFQCLGLERFSGFTDMGGENSFALALTDGQGNGILLTSLHSRTGTRIYAKPLAVWDCDLGLSEQEQAAVQSARQMGEHAHPTEAPQN